MDLWLCDCLKGEISRSLVQRWIKNGHVRLGSETELHSSRKMQSGERCSITVPRQEKFSLKPIKMDFPFIYEDKDLAVIHKPPGIAVHPAPNQSSNETTIAHGLLHLWQKQGLWQNISDSSEPNESLRPGIVHRLDRDTEGLLLIAKHETAKKQLMQLFSLQKISKMYTAWTWGSLSPSEGKIQLPISRHPIHRLKMQVHKSGRDAVSLYKTIQVKNTSKGRKFSQLQLFPLTGRTHQLRVHTAYHKAPVVGDPLYSNKIFHHKNFGLLLLAQRLVFTHPFSKKELDLSIDLPQRFVDFENCCGKL